MAFRPDGRLIAAGEQKGKHVALVKLGTVRSRPLDEPSASAGGLPAMGGVWSLAFSPAGDTLLAGDGRATCSSAMLGRTGHGTASESDWAAEDDANSRRWHILLTARRSRSGTTGAGWRSGTRNSPGSSRIPVRHQSLGAIVYSLAFFEACGRRQLAIGKETGLQYSPVDANPQGSEPPQACAIPRSASIGDETYRRPREADMLQFSTPQVGRTQCAR